MAAARRTARMISMIFTDFLIHAILRPGYLYRISSLFFSSPASCT